VTRSIKAHRCRGQALIEFTLVGLASIIVLVSTFQLGIGMWNYHTLAYAVHQGARYASVKGVGCTLPGNNCSVTVGTIAQKIAGYGIGVPADTVIVTLTANSGVATLCSPLNSCNANATVWPPATNTDNAVGKTITISAKYHSNMVLLLVWPGKSSWQSGSYWLSAASTQRIIF
jgi:Flp pilus assembly protein TadG